MSHFVRCDRCSAEDNVMGSLSLPPGWQKICGADLCEPCCMMVRDFIRFKPGDADKLPVEPIPAESSSPTPSDKLFETELEATDAIHRHDAATATPLPVPPNDDSEISNDQYGDIDHRGLRSGESSSESRTAVRSVAEEVSTEERARERKKRRMRRQSAILPDPRKPTEPPAGGVQP